jgi:tetratricopeptide (TPR) repeat protein
MMKKSIFLLVIFALVVRLASATDYIYEFLKANEFYEKGQYNEAIDVYNGILKAGKHSAELYYNLGNAYYKDGNLAQAIVAYERAQRLNPADEDIRHNLALAYTKTVDKIPVAEPFFLYAFIDELACKLSAPKWAFVQLFFLIGTVLLMFVFTFSKFPNLRKNAFYGALGLFGISVLVFFMALHVHHKMNVQEAVIITDIADVKSEPTENSTKLFNLHAGTKVNVSEMNGAWYYIQLSGDKKGWVYSSKIEML